jgi:hypothetical protein
MAGIVATIAFGAIAAPATAGTVTGKFVYSTGDNACPGQPARAPLANAPFRVKRKGAKAVKGRLDAKGSFKARIRGGRGPAEVEVTLADKELRVMPPGAGAKPYSFSHKFDGGAGHVFFILSGDQSGGTGSIWSALDRGRTVALKALPPGVKLRLVTAIFKNEFDPGGEDDVASSAYDPATEEILVGSRGRPDQFEPWVLLHEYGHHVHDHLGEIGPEAQGEHNADDVYPDQPALPFSEGFAHAFAAIVRENPVLGTQCRTAVNISTEPVTPAPQQKRYSQYNELSNAAVFWGLATALGRGDRQKGLARILTALKIYRRDGGPARHPRDLRDALIEAGFEKTRARNQELTNVFAAQRMNWAMSVHACPGCESEAAYQDEETWVTLRGPYGECAYQGRDGYVADGALAYTRADDCSVFAGVVVSGLRVNTEAGVLFPYLANNAHRGRHVFSVGWRCTSDDCPGSTLVSLNVHSGDCADSDRGWCGDNDGNPLAGRVFTANVTVPNGQEVEAVEFDGAGKCRIIPSGEDCGV